MYLLVNDFYRVYRRELSGRVQVAHRRYHACQGLLAIARCRVCAEKFRRFTATLGTHFLPETDRSIRVITGEDSEFHSYLIRFQFGGTAIG